MADPVPSEWYAVHTQPNATEANRDLALETPKLTLGLRSEV